MGTLKHGFFSGLTLLAACTAVPKGDKVGLTSLMKELRAAQLTGDTATAARITRGLIPNEARIRLGLRTGNDDMAKAIASIYARLPTDDGAWAGAFAAPAGNTEVQVHAATTEELATNAGSGEFPGGARRVAKAILKPQTTYYEVEFVKPGHSAGMKYHLFFRDGSAWCMLGPVWRRMKE